MESRQTKPMYSEEEKEQAAKRLAESFAELQEALADAALKEVDIVEELDKLGIELPPFAAVLFSVPDA